MRKNKDSDIKVERVKSYISISAFTLYHQRRVKILKKLLKDYKDKKLVTSIIMLSLESLASVRYPGEKSSKERFISLLSQVIDEKEAIRLYLFYRCPYIHNGVPNPFLDYEDDDNVSLSGMDEEDVANQLWAL